MLPFIPEKFETKNSNSRSTDLYKSIKEQSEQMTITTIEEDIKHLKAKGISFNQ